LQERRLDDAKWLMPALDGKSLAGNVLVLALGTVQCRWRARIGA